MPTMYKVKNQLGLSLEQKQEQIKMQAMDLTGRVQSLMKKGVKLDLHKLEILAKLAMIVAILKEKNIIDFPEIDMYYQQEFHQVLSQIEKQVESNNPAKKIIIAKNKFDFDKMKKNSGVN